MRRKRKPQRIQLDPIDGSISERNNDRGRLLSSGDRSDFLDSAINPSRLDSNPSTNSNSKVEANM